MLGFRVGVIFISKQQATKKLKPRTKIKDIKKKKKVTLTRTLTLTLTKHQKQKRIWGMGYGVVEWWMVVLVLLVR